MKIKNILFIIFPVGFVAIWLNMGGYHFFEFLKNPISEWEIFDYLVLFAVGSAIVGLIVKMKRNKILDRVKAVYQKPAQNQQSKIDVSDTLDVSQESIDKLEQSRKTFFWIFATLSGILAYFVLVHGVFNFDVPMNGKTGWSFARLLILLFWLVPSIFLCVFFQWSYKKQYSNVFVAKVLNNLKDLDVRFSKRNPKTLIQQYLPGLPSGGIKCSNTLSISFKQYTVFVSGIKIERGAGEGSKTVFRGTVISVDITNSNLTDTITLLPTAKNSGLWNLLKSSVNQESLTVNNKKLEKIELLSSDFKGLFNVYGNDQIESRKMLKPTIIEKILRLSAHEDLSALTIDQDSIIAAFDCVYFQGGFEPNFFLVKPQTINERIESIVNSINQVQSKAEKLYDLTT